MILAIGNSGVAEMKAFQEFFIELNKQGVDAVIFKQDRCLEGEYLSFEVVKNVLNYYVIIDKTRYNVEDFSAIWYMKPHLPFKLIEFQPAEYRQFIDRQFRAMRTGLWSIFQHKKWIDDPWKIQIAEDKLYQMKLALKVGFNIPT